MPDYDLNTESINSLVEDSQIKLPRFQRKLTWSNRDNFNLCLSVFKGYPLGVFVLSRNSGKKYLLDGRQRRYALDKMRNPENIYDWAKSAVGFYVKDSQDEVREKYWKYVDNYFGENVDDNSVDEPDDDSDTENSSQNNTDEELVDGSLTGLSNNKGKSEDQNIKKLLDIIIMVHEKRGKTSGLTKPFDFKKYVEGLDYVEKQPNGNRYINTEQLLDWIEYRSSGGRTTPDLDSFDEDIFYDWLMQRRTPGEGDNSQEETIRKYISRRWDQIITVLEQLQVLNATLNNQKVAYLEVRDVTADDEKKIFEIINSEGTDLTSVEILSAKPAYNIEIENPADQLLEDVDEMYQNEMGVEQTEAVRWDRPATFYERLDVESFLPKEGYGFERRVRIGFKLMSGYHLNGISKNEFEELSRLEINWGSIQLERDLCRMQAQLSGHTLFKFWNQWPDPFIRLSSEAVTINYLLYSYLLWEDLGKPENSSAKLSEFQNKSAILLDKSIYQYITQLWRGSTESRIEQNLSSFSKDSKLFDPVSSEDWRDLLEELINDGRIEGQSQLENKNPTNETKLILRYYNVVCGRRPSTDNISLDHIIPRTLFDSTPNDDMKKYKHHIANLAEIPYNDNTDKGQKSLPQIEDKWLISKIEKFTGIDSANFNKYTQVSDVEDLIENRGNRMINKFIQERKDILDVK